MSTTKFFACLAFTVAGTMNASNIFPSNGYVGIGNTSAAYLLTTGYNTSSAAIESDFELDSSAATGSAIAGLFTCSTQSGAGNTIRPLESYANRLTGALSGQTVGWELGVHSQVSGNGNQNIGLRLTSDHPGLSYGVRNYTGLMISGDAGYIPGTTPVIGGWKEGIHYFSTNGTSLFYVDCNGNAYAQTIAFPSSRAYKVGISPLPERDADKLLRGMTPVSFRYKENPAVEHFGFIAEDSPFAIKSTDGKSLRLMEVVAVLTAAVQENEQRIKALKSKLANLRTQ